MADEKVKGAAATDEAAANGTEEQGVAEAAAPVLQVAKELVEGEDWRRFSSGVWGRFVPVSQAIVQAALSQLKRPEPPMWYNPDKERDEPNPSDPAYSAAMERYEQEQIATSFDVFAMWGIELRDGIPEAREWLGKLKLMASLGRVDLGPYDLEDEIHLEYLYKRYIVMGNEEYIRIGIVSGISPGEVSRAAANFRGDQTRGADK